MAELTTPTPLVVAPSGDRLTEDEVHAACPVCNPADAAFVVTLCGIAQDPSEQVPPVGKVCHQCALMLPQHRCPE